MEKKSKECVVVLLDSRSLFTYKPPHAYLFSRGDVSLGIILVGEDS